MYRLYLKRWLDFLLALGALLLLWPVLALLILLVAPSTGWRPLFFQERPGLNGRVFCLIKLRTMNQNRDASGRLLPDKDRLTRMGRIIRSLSLDELPNLFNVLRGDMSLVGPRPLLVQYLKLYSPEQARRHEVLPGITGWAQVNGRNALSWNEKFAFDVYYVENVSFVLDMRILWMTFCKVLKREAVNRDAQTTMPAFGGN